MIRSRTSFTGIFSKDRDPWGPPGYSTNRITRTFPDRLVAQVQDSVANLGCRMGIVPFPHARSDEMHDLVSAGDEQLRDQPPMAALPGGLRAHHARRRLRERLVQGRLPGGRAHARCVARELAEAREELLARLFGAQPAELDGVHVRDARVPERHGQARLVELRIAARRREAPDVDEGLDARFAETFDQLRGRAAAVSDRVDYRSHTRRIAALTGKESTWPRR